MEIKVLRNILEDNLHCATSNNKYFKQKNIVSFNIMASPGAGKTSFITKTAQLYNDKKMFVIEGDIESSIDSEKLSMLGIPTLQINTGGSCHLNANMIGYAIKNMNVCDDSILFVENVGNLVCTASFDLGVDFNVVILSTTEGHDKPFKYPLIFEKADVIILNKIDLCPHLDFSYEEFLRGVRILNKNSPIFRVSCKDGDGFDEWVNWLKSKVSE